MNKKELKKLLAGLGIAVVIAGAGFSLAGCIATPCSEDKYGAGSIQMEKTPIVKGAPDGEFSGYKG